MSGSRKWFAAVAFATYSIIFVACSAHSPSMDYKNPAYVPSHQINPTPIMGIRG